MDMLTKEIFEIIKAKAISVKLVIDYEEGCETIPLTLTNGFKAISDGFNIAEPMTVCRMGNAIQVVIGEYDESYIFTK